MAVCSCSTFLVTLSFSFVTVLNTSVTVAGSPLDDSDSVAQLSTTVRDSSTGVDVSRNGGGVSADTGELVSSFSDRLLLSQIVRRRVNMRSIWILSSNVLQSFCISSPMLLARSADWRLCRKGRLHVHSVNLDVYMLL